MNLSPKWQQLTNGLFWLGALFLLYLAVQYIVPYLAPFILALVLAVLIDPTVDGLEERLRMPRGWAVIIALLFFFGLAAGLVLFGIGAIAVQLGQLSIDLPSQYAKLMAFSEDLLKRATEALSGLPADVVSFVETSVRGGLQASYRGMESVVRGILGGLGFLPSFFLSTVITVVATFFISRDKDLISDFALSLLPAGMRGRVAVINRDVVNSAVGLVKAQLTLVGLTFGITVTGLYFLDVRYAWLAGFVIGVLDVLPAMGPATVLVPWSVYCFIDGNSSLGTGLLILLGVISVFRQIMEPRIIGRRIGLHPLVTLLSLYLGIRLLGARGLVVGPLVAIVVKAVVRSGKTPPRTRAVRPGRSRPGAPPPDATGASGPPEPSGPSEPSGPPEASGPSEASGSRGPSETPRGPGRKGR